MTVYSYEMDLKPVRRYLGGKKPKAPTKADGDALVRWMLTEAHVTAPLPRRLTGGPGGRDGGRAPDGITAAYLVAALPDSDVHTCLTALVRAGRVTRVRRGVYAPAAEEGTADKRGLSPQTVRHADHVRRSRPELRRSGCVGAQRHFACRATQGRRPDETVAQRAEDTVAEATAKSRNLAEVQQFRETASDHRLYAC